MFQQSSNPQTKSGVSRRQFLETGSLGAAILILPEKTPFTKPPESDNNSPNIPPCEVVPPTSLCYEAFAEPPMIATRQGEVKLQLEVELKEFVYRKGTDLLNSVPSRTYSRNVPGPTLLVDPGDQINIYLENQLLGNKSCGEDNPMNTPRCYNTTNLHFHGLHVSPLSYCDSQGHPVLSSDDVLLEVEPKETPTTPPHYNNWCVWLPDFHAPGTHWYHAHHHGSTGLQVSNGMAGAIIVREPTPELNIVDDYEDKIWIIQEIIEKSSVTDDPDDAVYLRRGQDTGGDFLVNGRFCPTIEMSAGKMQRWRLINATATPRGLMTVKLYRVSEESCTQETICDNDPNGVDLASLWLMAVDGISFYGKPPQLIGEDLLNDGTTSQIEHKLEGWQMAPGNRADFLVRLPAGCYKLVKDAHPAQGSSLQENSRQVLAYINVIGELDDRQKIPETIPSPSSNPQNPYEPFPYLSPITDSEVTNQQDGKICPRVIDFSTNGGGNPKNSKYFINGQQYDPNVVDVRVMLNDVEQWELKTSSGSAHPFHIHVNPFQVMGDKIDPAGPDTPDNWRWFDTIAVSRGDENQVTIRQRFSDYHGNFVSHCHMLIHEDIGMMMNVVIDEDENNQGVLPCHSLNRNGESIPSPAIPSDAVVCPLLPGEARIQPVCQ